MHTLIVTAHPDSHSHTHAVVTQLAAGITTSGLHSVEIADLAAEQFDPRFNQADFDQFKLGTVSPADVLAEQQRLNRADALVLVYPIYWWSFPAQLKGWIDRVFTQGWAYDDTGEKVIKKLGHLQVHLLALGAANTRTYLRRGYFSSMRNQIDEGIFGYCGAPIITSELLLPSDEGYPDAHYALAQQLGQRLFTLKEPA
ncbi:NAD(P)H-dependent oxidoreductase [Pantoea sp. Acro-805]|uniref:NAD(P)H-dependent oxidoreductase n=1 Tax=Candidatus Pantoea formicae TaxID=2608355 RepID=A0ABX0QTD7_9GAMM|nr:NAD(P)H-dependent oxidoreductase [Pantoea formicae]MDF7649605.1 NAD(P)H-dependent oxidoreductase [Erwiniaceae bacterium L1_54_3]NIF00319.1 NAD(P)H-dependent oxidoreductase [Pantoea formicae]